MDTSPSKILILKKIGLWTANSYMSTLQRYYVDGGKVQK